MLLVIFVLRFWLRRNIKVLEDSGNRGEFMEILTEAKEEWVQAQNYFDNVSEPDLVDYAIYRLEAAKRGTCI